MSKLRLAVLNIIHAECGQTLVEYGLIISLIALVAIGAMTAMAGSVDGLYGVLQGASDTMACHVQNNCP